jgi:hypothetical protein
MVSTSSGLRKISLVCARVGLSFAPKRTHYVPTTFN